ncbi:MAG: GNAT family N-acetyltransferase [Akkermansiaceae bacterium]
MNLEITSKPSRKDQATVIEGTRNHNQLHTPSDYAPLCIFDRLESGEIIAGLTAKTYWNYLDIAYLWVAEPYRKQGKAPPILKAAENEALRRDCHYAILDTYSFQALGFYKKIGYSEFGELDHFSGTNTRHYLRKRL